MSTADGHKQFNVTLPEQVIENMMALKSCGLYGTTRAEIARALILDMLKQPQVQELIRQGAAGRISTAAKSGGSHRRER